MSDWAIVLLGKWLVIVFWLGDWAIAFFVSGWAIVFWVSDWAIAFFEGMVGRSLDIVLILILIFTTNLTLWHK